jgi:hypothetical protein
MCDVTTQYDQKACDNSQCPDEWDGPTRFPPPARSYAQCKAPLEYLGQNAQKTNCWDSGGSFAYFGKTDSRDAYSAEQKHGWAMAIGCNVPWLACGIKPKDEHFNLNICLIGYLEHIILEHIILVTFLLLLQQTFD